MRSLRIRACLVATALLAATAAPAATADLAGRLDAVVGRYAELELFNGSALVASGGDVVLERGYGMADFEWSIPNSPETRFRLGSITKQFTSMLVMQLVEQGALTLDATLADVLPWYRQETGRKVTVHHLLNHTSGVPSYTSLPGFFRDHGRDAMPLEELVARFCSGDLEFEPGSTYRYSNSGYVILGAVIEHVSGKPYEQLLRERILDPLGMTATGYDHSDAIIPNRAAGYERTLDGLRNAEYLDMSIPHAAGALYSTVRDLARWDRALYGTNLLSEAGKARIFTPGLANYGYGWGIRQAEVGPDKAPRTLIRHGGGINGFSTFIVRVPEDRHLIVLLDNTGEGPLGAIADGLLEVLYGREPAPPKQPIGRVLAATLRSGGIDAALAQYRKLREAKDDYAVAEPELNELGYSLLRAGRIDDAIAIFTLNVESFPEAANPYDSLAEAYAAKGEKALAIKNYARSLELDPGNRNAVEQLQKLVQP